MLSDKLKPNLFFSKKYVDGCLITRQPFFGYRILLLKKKYIFAIIKQKKESGEDV